MFSNFTNSELAMIAIALDEEEEEKVGNIKKQVRSKWIHSAWKTRNIEGEFRTLFPHLMDDETKFYQYFRMTQSTFHKLLTKLEKKLMRKDTFWRLPIAPKERLAVCLR